jgi:hypothetical protein
MSGSASELGVFVECREVVLGLAARWVERLVLPDVVVKGPEPASAGKRRRPVVSVGERRYAAWDLGSMLGLSPVARAWLLLRVPHAGGELPIALRTGACLVVRELGGLTALPAGMFTLRAHALGRAFAVERVAPGRGRSVGLYLDVPRLWAESELAASAAALAEAA